MSTILKISGYDDPSLEGGPLGRQKGDPTEKQIWGFTNKDGERVPGMVHGIREYGFMVIARNPPEELAQMTDEEKAECAAAESDRLFHPAFHPAWNAETRLARRMHNPGDFRQRNPDEEGVGIAEHSMGDILAGMN